MKKVMVVLACAAMLFFLPSCAVFEGLERMEWSFDERGEQLFLQLIDVLENGDEDEYIGLFFPECGAEYPVQLKENYREMSAYYQGTMESYVRVFATIGEMGQYVDGKLTSASDVLPLRGEDADAPNTYLNYTYRVQTDKGDYLVAYEWIAYQGGDSGFVSIHVAEFGVGIKFRY